MADQIQVINQRVTIMSRLKKAFIIFLLYSTASVTGYSATLQDALQKAAVHFTKTSAKIKSGQQIVINITNYHSQERDQLASQIEVDLYFALEKHSSDLKLIDLNEAAAGVSSRNTVFIKGSYQQKGKTITLRLQAVKGALTGEIVSQVDVSFDLGSTRSRNLVAVLDMESDSLSDS